MIEQTYPSGRVVKNTVNADDQLTDVSSKSLAQTSFHSYANNFSYTSAGAVSSMRLGNGNWESAQYNSRLQVTQIGLGSSSGAVNLWKADYAYGEIDAGGNLIAVKNNGNIARQTISYADLANPFLQSYKYDSLNRLQEAKEMSLTTQTWKQTFGHDRFGNRTAFSQEMIGTAPTTQTPGIDSATNRLVNGQGTYDANGNLITDSLGRQFIFDGNNRQKEVRDAASATIGTYFY